MYPNENPLELSLQDEQNTVDFYLEIADESINQSIYKKKRSAGQQQMNRIMRFGFYIFS